MYKQQLQVLVQQADLKRVDYTEGANYLPLPDSIIGVNKVFKARFIYYISRDVQHQISNLP